MQQYVRTFAVYQHLRFIHCTKFCGVATRALPLCATRQCEGISFADLGAIYVSPLKGRSR